MRKFELNKTKAIASFSSNTACVDAPVKFKNTSLNANKFQWILNNLEKMDNFFRQKIKTI
jgi:hypothetical protein